MEKYIMWFRYYSFNTDKKCVVDSNIGPVTITTHLKSYIVNMESF